MLATLVVEELMKSDRMLLAFALGAIAITASFATGPATAQTKPKEPTTCEALENCYSLDCMIIKWMLGC